MNQSAKVPVQRPGVQADVGLQVEYIRARVAFTFAYYQTNNRKGRQGNEHEHVDKEGCMIRRRTMAHYLLSVIISIRIEHY